MRNIALLIIDVPMKICGPAKFEKWYCVIAIMYHVFAVYLSCICYEHGLCVDTHVHTHTIFKIVTFIS
jgi:hypothetical protein